MTTRDSDREVHPHLPSIWSRRVPGTGTTRPESSKYHAETGGQPADSTKVDLRLAHLIVESLLRGQKLPLASLGPHHQQQAAMILEDILYKDQVMLYWQKKGCIEVGEDGMYIVRPAPAEAVVGWLGYGLKLKKYLPKVPEEIAGKEGSIEELLEQSAPSSGAPTTPRTLPTDRAGDDSEPPAAPRRRADPELRTREAMQVAVYMLQNKILGQPFIARGLEDVSKQVLAVQLMAHFARYLGDVAFMTKLGMPVTQPDGTTQWVRPGPPHVIAAALGIGPDTGE